MSSLLLVLYVCSLVEFTKSTHVELNSSSLVNYNENVKTAMDFTEQNILAVVNALTVANERLSDILTNQNLQTQILYPKECDKKLKNILDAEKKLAIRNIGACNIMNVLTNLVIVIVDTIRFFVEVSVDTTIIIGEVVACTSSFNPFVIIKCVIRGFTLFPEQMREMIDVAEDYRDVMEYFVPKIFVDIENCFNRTVSGYDKAIQNILNNAQICNT